MADEKVKVEVIAEDKATSVIKGIMASFGGLAGIAGGVLKLGLGVATAGFGALASGIALSIKEAMAAEKVFAQTEAVIRSTGQVAGITADAAAELAKEFSLLTTYTDDAILAGENILLTFTNIGKDVFPTATQTILDMSTALGQDLQSSAIQLGKALQDPILGVTALRRVGVNFSEAQQEIIAKLVEENKLFEAQSLILKELQIEFGGSAEAAGDTLGGKLEILKNRFDDLLETVGGRLLGTLEGPLNSALETLGGILDEVGREGGPLDRVLNAFGQMVQNIQFGMSPLDAFRNAFANLLPPEVVEMLDRVILVVDELTLALSQPEMQAQLKALGAAFLELNIETVSAALNILIETLLAFSGFVAENGPTIAAIFGIIGDALSALGQSIAASVLLLDGWAEAWRRVFAGDFEGAFKALTDGIAGYLEGIVGIFSDTPKQAIQGFINGINAWTAPARDAITNFSRTIEKAMKDALGIKSPSTVFEGIGKNVIDGMIAGINEDPDAVYDSLKGVVDAGIANIKKDLGIASPSKVFAQLGANMIAGLDLGIQRAVESSATLATFGLSSSSVVNNSTRSEMYGTTVNVYPESGASLADLLSSITPSTAGL